MVREDSMGWTATPLTRNCNNDDSNSDNENINKLHSFDRRTGMVVLEVCNKPKKQDKKQNDCRTELSV